MIEVECYIKIHITHRGTVDQRDDNLRGCEPSRDEMSGDSVSLAQPCHVRDEAGG